MSTEALSCGPESGWGVPQSSPISYRVLSQKFPVTPIGEGGVVVGAPTGFLPCRQHGPSSHVWQLCPFRLGAPFPLQCLF